MKDQIVEYKVQWRGIVLLIVHHVDEDEFGKVAISVQSLQPCLAPLPVANGGVFGRSCMAASIEAAGGPIRYILDWMEAAADKNGWQAKAVAPDDKWWDDAYAEEFYSLFGDLPLIVAESAAQNGSA